MQAEPRYYVWKPAGKNISIHFDLAVVDAMRAAVLKAPHSEAERRDEVGGLLLGRVEPGANIIVDGFELLSSEHKRGASFILSSHDGEKLATRLQWWSERRNEREPVGFFRSHTRSGLYLDRNDQEVLSRFFAKPSDVALLVRPAADGACTAGCFFWEDVAVQGMRTNLEFPFESRRLAPQSYSPALLQQPDPARVLPAARKRIAPIPFPAAALGLLLLPLLAFYAYRVSTTRPKAETDHRRALAARDGDGANDSIEGLPVIEERVKLSAMKNQRDPQTAGAAPLTSASRASASPAKVRRQPIDNDRTTAAPVLPPPPSIEGRAMEGKAMDGKDPVHLAIAPSPKRPALPPPSATVVLEPVNESFVRRAVSHVPALSLLQRHRFKGGDRFIPARPVGNLKPIVPRELRSKISGVVPVDLKISVDKTGAVAETELLTKKIDSALAEHAVKTASQWDFMPARINSRAVNSELLVHLRYGEQPQP